MNLAEEAQRIRALRERERALIRRRSASRSARRWRSSGRAGVPAERDGGSSCGALRIELVLTAHPTEAKRRTVLSKLQRIGEALARLRRSRSAARASARARWPGSRAEITALWLTERARTARPAVTDEVRTGLYFVDEVFWDALPRIAAELDAALAEHYPGSRAAARLAHAGLVDRRRPRRQPVGRRRRDRRDAPAAPRARRRAASPVAARPGPPPQRERPALPAAARAARPGSRRAGRCPPAWPTSSERYAEEPYRLALVARSPPTSRRPRTRT